MYCNLCKRPVEAKRNIGVGSLLLVLITGGIWLIAILFYSKRCTICKSDALGSFSSKSSSGDNGIPQNSKIWLFILGVIIFFGVMGNFLKTKPVNITSTTPVAAKVELNIPTGCKKIPFEIFPVGSRLSSVAITDIANSNCPNAIFHTDEKIEVQYAGKRVFILSKRIGNSYPKVFEIESIKSE